MEDPPQRANQRPNGQRHARMLAVERRPLAGRAWNVEQSAVRRPNADVAPVQCVLPCDVSHTDLVELTAGGLCIEVLRRSRAASGTSIPLAGSNFGRAVSSDAAKTLRHARPSQRRTKSSAAPGVAAGGVCTTVFGEASGVRDDASTVLWRPFGMRASGCRWRGDRVAAKGASAKSANARMRSMHERIEDT